MSEIPRNVRVAVDRRERGRCLRCGGPGTDVHHRRRRREGGHGVANLILLCRTCHSWAHGHPARARDLGLIVSVYGPEPTDIPIQAWNGWMNLTDDGGFTWSKREEQG